MSNLYGKSCTPNLGGVSDFYTKPEINALLASKANTSTTYTRTYIDAELLSLSQQIDGVAASQITEAELTATLSDLETDIFDTISGLYALQATTYTKSEVNALIDAIDLDPSSYIRTAPGSTGVNTIFPGASNAVALTLRGSSTNTIVQEWLSNNSNRIGYVGNDGGVVFERTLDLGRLVSDGEAALNVRTKRITGVGTPVLGSDAVPYSTLQSYVLDFYEEIIRPDPETFYTLDGGLY